MSPNKSLIRINKNNGELLPPERDRTGLTYNNNKING